MINKRIWKAGALAALATLAFAVFAFKVEEWSKGFDSEFIVYGQSAGTGGTSGGTGTAATVTKVIPQVVAGSYDGGLTKYTTVIQIVNTGAASINVSGNFYTTTGAASSLAYTGATITGGALASTALGVNGVLVIRTPDSATAGTTNWAKIVTTGNASVSAYFELRDGLTNVLYTRVGIASSASNLTRFLIPRVRNTATSLDVGFALVNTGATAANMTVTARDAGGTILGSPRVYSANAGAHIASFANQFLTLSSEAAGTNYGFLLFESTSAQWAVTALAVEGAALSSFPVEVLQ